MTDNSKPSEPPVAADIPVASIASARGGSARRLPLSWSIRIVAICAGLVVSILLMAARCLEPDPSGMGTHQQLGLPACTSVAIFGIRCPGCGMTTSWALLLRGQVAASFITNSGGALLAIIGLAYIPWSCYFFFRGVSSRGERFSMALAALLTLAMAVSIIQWLIRWIATGDIRV